jgi:isoquinoline 1-oxidoreductase subunit beta
MSVTLKRPENFKLIGTPAKRLDTPAKVNGTAVYGIDARPPGVKIATLAQSPVFGGRVKNVDDAKAKAVKGVRQIVRLDDAVAVVADHMGAAKKGLAALTIEWDDGPHAKLSTQDIAAELEKATLNSGPVAQNIGDPEKAMATAVTKVEATYQVPLLAHAALEPMNCTVHVRKDGCEIWVGNQALARAQATAAKTAGLPLDKVVVHNHLIGGGAAEKAGWGKPLPDTIGRGVSVQFVFGTYLAQVAEVEVSKDGAVRVWRVVCAVDCGTVVNPDTVQAQIQSAIIFGITAALHGQIH